MDSRKEAVLEAIVRDYIETGSPVGSLGLAQKYQFPYSTATIRAEMAELENLGFLTHPHTSAGRIPTEKGYRYFVNLMEAEVELLSHEGRAVEKRLSAMRDRFERRLEAASEILSDLTHTMSFAGVPGELFTRGLGNLFSQPEFLDPLRILKVANVIDNLNELVSELPQDHGTRIFIGSEAPIGKAAGVSVVVSGFSTPMATSGFLGILGPMRMNYSRNLAAVNEVKSFLEA